MMIQLGLAVGGRLMDDNIEFVRKLSFNATCEIDVFIFPIYGFYMYTCISKQIDDYEIGLESGWVDVVVYLLQTRCGIFGYIRRIKKTKWENLIEKLG